MSHMWLNLIKKCLNESPISDVPRIGERFLGQISHEKKRK